MNTFFVTWRDERTKRRNDEEILVFETTQGPSSVIDWQIERKQRFDRELEEEATSDRNVFDN